MATPSVVGTNSGNGIGPANITVTLPVGSVGAIAVVARYYSKTVTPPSGWTLAQTRSRGNMRLDIYVGAVAAGSVWQQTAGDQPTTIVLAGYDRAVSVEGFVGADGSVSPAIGVTSGDLIGYAYADWADDGPSGTRTAPSGTSNSRIYYYYDGGGGNMFAAIAHKVAASTGTEPTAAWGGESAPWQPQAGSFRITDATPEPVEGKFVTSTDGRRFLDQNGDPVLLKGDSPWSAMANTSVADWTAYCQYLASRGFNTIILDLVPLPAGGGPYVRAEAETYDGLKPFTTFGNWSTASGAYWTRVDTFVTTAETYGLSVAMVPAYASQGSPGSAADVLSGQTTTQIQGYGTFLGNRYKTAPNVLWFIGGDYGADLVGSPNNAAVWAEYVSAYNTLAAAIAATGDTHLVTTHLYPPPSGTRYTGSTSADHTGLAIADFEFTYIYEPPYPVVRRARGLASHPVIFGEGNYSQENNQGGPSSTNETLRRAALWAYSSGAAGDFMGTEQWRGQTGWTAAIPRTVYGQMQAIHEAVESIPWWKLVPDASNVFLTSGQGTQPSSGTQDFLGVDPLESSYATASVSTDGTVGVVYVPTARAFTVDLSKLGSTSRTLRRVDPTNGTSTSMTVSGSIASAGANASGDSDWLYIFEADPLPVQIPVTASFAGSGSLSAAAGAVYAVSAAFSGSGVLAAAVETVLTPQRTALFTGSGSLTATVRVAVAAPFTGAGTLSASVSSAWARTAAFNGSGALSAAVTSRIARSAAFTGSGTLAASVTTPGVVVAAFSGEGVLTASVATVAPVAVAAEFEGAGVLSAEVAGVYTFTVFTPPTVTERWSVDHRFFSRLTKRTGTTVLKKADGLYYQYRDVSDEEISSAVVAYLGGRSHRVSGAEAAALIEAGYGEYLSTEEVFV